MWYKVSAQLPFACVLQNKPSVLIGTQSRLSAAPLACWMRCSVSACGIRSLAGKIRISYSLAPTPTVPPVSASVLLCHHRHISLNALIAWYRHPKCEIEIRFKFLGCNLKASRSAVTPVLCCLVASVGVTDSLQHTVFTRTLFYSTLFYCMVLLYWILRISTGIFCFITVSHSLSLLYMRCNTIISAYRCFRSQMCLVLAYTGVRDRCIQGFDLHACADIGKRHMLNQ